MRELAPWFPTLWPIDDANATLFAESVYEDIFISDDKIKSHNDEDDQGNEEQQKGSELFDGYIVNLARANQRAGELCTDSQTGSESKTKSERGIE